MKSIKTTILVLFTITTISAKAVYIPGWERPILNAQLAEIDGDGHEIKIGLDKNLIMTQKDGSPNPSGLIFSEEVQVKCITDPCHPHKVTKRFRILSKTPVGCGSLTYKGIEVKNRGGELDPDPSSPQSSQIEIVDHTSRVCEDYLGDSWEVKISTGRGFRTLVGDPKPVYTIQ